MEIYCPVILDGATGTELQKRGYDGSVAAEQWVIEHPDAIKDIQSGYIDAGSNIVYAATFGANRVKLEEHGLFSKVDEYNKKLVAISKENVAGRAFIGGDISPSGLFLAPTGDTPFEELVDVYKEQAKALDEAGVDLFAVETMMTVADARAAILAIREVSEKPIFVTFTCDIHGKTLTGSDMTAVLLIMQGMGAAAFGLNCSYGPKEILEQCRNMSEYAEIPLIAKPNAGQPKIVDGKAVYDLSPDDFVAYYEDFIDAGVGYFGGCCGSTKEHVAALAKRAKEGKERFVKPVNKYKDMLNLASEKKAFILPRDIKVDTVLDCDDSFEDSLAELMAKDEWKVSDGFDKVLGIRLSSEESTDYLADAGYMLDAPVCFFCENEELLEAALRVYQGRAMYEGNLDEKVLERLSDMYGLEY